MNLSTAKKIELVKFATENNLMSEDEANEMGKEALAAFIRDSDVESSAQPDVVAESGDAPRVKLTIHEQEGIGGRDRVNVGINGKVYSIKRGIPVMVPPEVIANLNDAVITSFDPIPEKPGEYEERTYRRFNYQVG